MYKVGLKNVAKKIPGFYRVLLIDVENLFYSLFFLKLDLMSW